MNANKPVIPNIYIYPRPDQNPNLPPIINIHPRKPFPGDLPPITNIHPRPPETLRAKLLEMTHPPIAQDLITINDEINNLRADPQNKDLLKHPNVFSFAIAEKNWDLLSWVLLHQVVHTNNTPVLNLSNCKLTPEQFQALLNWLPSHPGKLALDLTNIKIKHSNDMGGESIYTESDLGPDEMKEISNVLEIDTNLIGLNLSNCNIGANGAKTLDEALRANTTLKEIDLSYNNLESLGAWAIGKILKHNHTLSVINIEGNGIDKESIKEIAQGLMNNHSVTSLNLQSNILKEEGAKILAAAMKNHATLASINLGYCGIGDKGIQAIGNVLKSMKELSEAHLQGNSIGLMGRLSIKDALTENKTLRLLNISMTSLGDEGAKTVSEGLASNNTLTTFIAASNKLSITGAQTICNALSGKKTIASLDLSSNLFNGSKGQIKAWGNTIAALLKNTPALTALSLARSALYIESLIPMSLNSNKSLVKLDISQNGFGNKDTAVIGAILNNYTALIMLNLARNNISDQGIDPICNALKKNQSPDTLLGLLSLEWLDLSGNELDEKGAGEIKRALPFRLPDGKALEVDISGNKFNRDQKMILTNWGNITFNI